LTGRPRCERPRYPLHAMKNVLRHFDSHRRLLLSLLIGIVVAVAWPGHASGLGRALLGWNTFVWFYLAWVVVTILRADQKHLQSFAVAQAESASLVLAFVVLAAAVSVGAVLVELTAAKGAGARIAWPHVVFAGVTVIGSWLLVPTLFTLSYASLFYGREPGGGLDFPGASKDFEPDYSEFLYFSFTIAVALQTADVNITSRHMRKLVLLHSVLAFLFNTTILAFVVNVGASML
jgi:uncharacterized membrane protein